jgi:hypothetical protein
LLDLGYCFFRHPASAFRFRAFQLF